MPVLPLLQIFLASLWVGGALMIGYLAVPVIFSTLATDRYLAGTIAGNIFGVLSWSGLGIGAILLVSFYSRYETSPKRQTRIRLVLANMVLIAINHFVLSPLIVVARAQRAAGDKDAAVQFAWLHGGASLLFLVASILGVWLLVHLLRYVPRNRDQGCT